jgi:hypothetical protein
MTWYVIDTRKGKIINAIETSSNYEPDLTRIYGLDAGHMRLDPYPPQRLLDAYQYYNERP